MALIAKKYNRERKTFIEGKTVKAYNKKTTEHYFNPIHHFQIEEGLKAVFHEYNGYHPTTYGEMITLDGKKYLNNVSKRHESVQLNSNVLGGMPSIANTRIPLSLILGCLRDGMTLGEICEDYQLTQEQLTESINYVIDVLNLPFSEED
ncbi:MAG TPA: DUF433 domain-containing protein [Bacillales bacterium]|nr:DUF433 domain-containing protein [Bacillales bacterium]